MIGVGTDYPKYLWHKQSYASLINWSARYDRGLEYDEHLNITHMFPESLHWDVQGS